MVFFTLCEWYSEFGNRDSISLTIINLFKCLVLLLFPLHCLSDDLVDFFFALFSCVYDYYYFKHVRFVSTHSVPQVSVQDVFLNSLFALLLSLNSRFCFTFSFEFAHFAKRERMMVLGLASFRSFAIEETGFFSPFFSLSL